MTDRLLIFHTGSLGDTLVSVPALGAIRDHFRDAHITLLSELQTGRNYIQPRDVLEGAGLVDDYIQYPAGPGGKTRRFLNIPRILRQLRRKRYDTLIYLVRSRPRKIDCYRDLAFFRLAGIKKVLGQKAMTPKPLKIPGQPLPMMPHKSDQLLSRLANSGIRVPTGNNGMKGLAITPRERQSIHTIIRGLPGDGGRPWVAVGPGSKMPAKKWPMERYLRVARKLVQRYDIWPVIFGGPEDEAAGDHMVNHLGRGHVFAGRLNIREGIAALERCALYLGNDTGTLHMAATAGIPCVGIYSSRDYPGSWYPHGPGHVVFRTAIACEGCMLDTCEAHHMRCILSITPQTVYTKTAALLEKSIRPGSLQHAK